MKIKNHQKVLSGTIEKCKKCFCLMERWKRIETRMDKCYYLEWDYCKNCRHVQHYEIYKKQPTLVIENIVI